MEKYIRFSSEGGRWLEIYFDRIGPDRLMDGLIVSKTIQQELNELEVKAS